VIAEAGGLLFLLQTLVGLCIGPCAKEKVTSMIANRYYVWKTPKLNSKYTKSMKRGMFSKCCTPQESNQYEKKELKLRK